MEDFKTLTIKNIPKNTLLILKDNAIKEGISLNQYILNILQNLTITNEYNSMKLEFKRLFELTLARLDNNTELIERCEKQIEMNSIIISEVIDNGEE